MNTSSTLPALQKSMDVAFDNYFDLSDLLRDDFNALLDTESESQHYRRNYIRVSASLIEGWAHCIREICVAGAECDDPNITKKDIEFLRKERSHGADKRIKCTLRIAFKLFELQPAPNFGGPEWPRARNFFSKRDGIMHPKNPAGFEVLDDVWNELESDVPWILEQLFNFSSALYEKYGT